MAAQLIDIAGQRCAVLDAGGDAVRDAASARDLIMEAWEHRASLLAVPVSRFDPSFFDLRSGVAGDVLQKFVNYRIKCAVVGDVSAYIEASKPFRDLVVESNRGRDFFFVPDMDALAEHVAALAR
jgi:hypothetical protein